MTSGGKNIKEDNSLKAKEDTIEAGSYLEKPVKNIKYFVLILLILISVIYTIYSLADKNEITKQDTSLQITEIFTYGNYLNLKGNLTIDEPFNDIKIILRNKKNIIEITPFYVIENKIGRAHV